MSNAGAVLTSALLADGENKKSGPIGLAVILLLCVACYFLFKSMSKHLRKVREEFPDGTPALGGELSVAPRTAPTEHAGDDEAASGSAQAGEPPPTSNDPP